MTTHQSAHVRPRAVCGPSTTLLWALGGLGAAGIILLIATDQEPRWERLYLIAAIGGIIGVCTCIVVTEHRKTREQASHMQDDSLLASAAMAEQMIGEVLRRLADEPAASRPARPPLALVGDTPANGIAILTAHSRHTGAP